MPDQFRDRSEAGRELAGLLQKYANRPDVIVLALPRGGLPVGLEVARELNAPLDIFLVRKLGLPGHPELAMGAIATGGVVVLNEDVVGPLHVPPDVIEDVAVIEREELDRRQRVYRGDRPPPDLRHRIVILVDDGLATGATMRAAVAAIQRQRPERVVVAVPTASPDVCQEFAREVDEIICAMTPEPFYAVGLWYQDFPQVTDDEVRDLLRQAPHPYKESSNE